MHVKTILELGNHTESYASMKWVQYSLPQGVVILHNKKRRL